MKEFKNFRPLFYRERMSVEEFEGESILWEKLYSILKAIPRDQNIDPLEVLNDVRALCVWAGCNHEDGTLKEICLKAVTGIKSLVRHRQRNSWGGHIEWYAVNPLGEYTGIYTLIYTLVYMVLTHLNNPSKRITRVLERGDEYDYVLKNTNKSDMNVFFPEGWPSPKDIAQTFDIDLSPKPELPERLPNDINWWNTLANKFDTKEGIDLCPFLEILPIWELEQQLQVLERAAKIWESQGFNIRNAFEPLEKGLRARIQLESQKERASFKNCIVSYPDHKDEIIEALHKYADGSSTTKDKMCPIKAAMAVGLISRPDALATKEEFNLKINVSQINHYIQDPPKGDFGYEKYPPYKTMLQEFTKIREKFDSVE